jgi:hypothetical protein
MKELLSNFITHYSNFSDALRMTVEHQAMFHVQNKPKIELASAYQNCTFLWVQYILLLPIYRLKKRENSKKKKKQCKI